MNENLGTRTTTVVFFDIDLQEHIYTLEMDPIPRIGETVFFEETEYLVRDVYWYFDRKTKHRDYGILQEVVISLEVKVE